MSSQYDEHRKALEAKRDELEQRLAAIAKDVAHTEKALERDFEEQAVENENEEVLQALSVSGRNELDAVYRALGRIERGQYGSCTKCGKVIGVQRLTALPYVEHCIDCAD